MSNKGFTEPEGMDQPVIGDEGSLQDGQTLYLGEDQQNLQPQVPRQNSVPNGPAPVSRGSNFYWNEHGVLMDSTTGQPAPQQGQHAPQVQQPVYQPQPAPVDESKPKSHLIQLPDKFVIILDVPGVPRDNITIDFDEPTLTVTGTRANPIEEYVARYGEEIQEQSNKYYGEFKLSYKMTKNIDGIDATMEDGTLKIEAKFKAKTEPTSISIK
jgi:HSP20 family protein